MCRDERRMEKQDFLSSNLVVPLFSLPPSSLALVSLQLSRYAPSLAVACAVHSLGQQALSHQPSLGFPLPEIYWNPPGRDTPPPLPYTTGCSWSLCSGLIYTYFFSILLLSF